MSQSHAADQLAILRAAFPRETIPTDTLVLYLSKLQDIEPELLKATVDRIVETAKFFPAISEIRRTAARLAGILPPEPAEALAMIRSCESKRDVFRRDGSFAYTEHEWDWARLTPEQRDFCQDVLAKVGDPQDFNSGERRFAWDSGFQKAAEQVSLDAAAKVIGNLLGAKLLPTAKNTTSIEARK